VDEVTRPRRQPAAFLGHGSPMNAIEENRYTAAWRALGASLEAPPRAVLVVSAHWYVDATAVTAMPRPRTIHDFYGFPPELFAFEYPAPGAPEVAEEVVALARPARVGLARDGWGLDHGAWVVLCHLFPKADVPVLELSVNALEPPEYHLELGSRLAALGERGVLVLASGNVVHNLRALAWRRPEAAFDWALRFDEAARAVMTQRPSEAPGLSAHADFHLAAPTPDHFLPLLYVAGIAAARGERAEVLVEGCTMGSLSMTAYTVGVAGAPAGAAGEAGSSPPDSDGSGAGGVPPGALG